MDIRTGIIQAANALGIDPLDLATAISYETAGTFNPTTPGPTTRFGQHRGFIQFGEPQAKQHGVDWNDPIRSQLGDNGAVVSYLRSSGVKPGMGLLDIYSAINAGAPGLYNRSDAAAGGAPGTVRDKVMNQMSGHRKKAAELLGMKTSMVSSQSNPAASVAADTMTASGRGAQPMTPDQNAQGAAAQSTGMQPAQMEEAQKPRGGLLGNLFGDQDTMARLAIAFNSMRLNPDPNIATLMNAQMKERRDTKRREDELNKTIAFFDSLKDPTLSKLARVNPTAAFALYQRQVAASKDPNVQSSQYLPGMSGSILTMRDGSQKVVTVGGEELTGQAAVDFVNKDRENYVAGQRSIYGARREGTLGATIELGGEAARVEAEGKDAPRIAAENLKDASLVRSSIANIDNAIAAIDEGAQSGIVYNMLPDFTLASASLTNAMNRLGLDVIGSVTFGALSAAELALAMETAVPRNLPPAQLREWLTRHKAAQEKAYLALIETAQHFAGGGSMADYLQKIKATSGTSQMPPATPQPSAAPRATHRYNPTTKQVEEINQ